MPELPFRLVTGKQAAQFRSATAGRGDQLNPRRVEAGDHAGKFAFSENVMFDKEFADLHPILRVACPDSIVLDTDTAWPVVEEARG